MKEDMCEGTDADKGVLAQKTELPGIYPDLLAPLMMMTVLKMMTMAIIKKVYWIKEVLCFSLIR